jgi:uncharacterized protein
MVEQSAVFAWYELLTTDVSAAQSFYGKVLGWDVQDASTSEFAYRLFSVGGTPVAGLMELPLDGWKKGATPRWVGYVAVEDVDGVVDQLKRLGGTVYVLPTDSNVGRARGGRRSADRDARPGQGIEIWRPRCRARRAWPRLLA